MVAPAQAICMLLKEVMWPFSTLIAYILEKGISTIVKLKLEVRYTDDHEKMPLFKKKKSAQGKFGGRWS